MKKLYLLRHAKSSWDNPTLEDFDRPLNNRGKNQLQFMKKYILKNLISPELILCSSSKRTKLTHDGIFDENTATIFMDDLYHASAKEILNIIKKTNNKIDSIMVISHNPGLNELVYNLINYNENIQTCSLVEIDVNTHMWCEINENNSKFVSYTNPPKKN